MKNKNVIYFIIGALIITIVTIIIIVAGKSKKNNDYSTTSNTDNEIDQQLVLSEEEKPYISLTPQSDGHRLDLEITNIPNSIAEIEYDLIYTAQDEDLEIEKGVGGTTKIENDSVKRELLLGTESCTNGCKYKYDDGVTGGTLSLNFIASNGQSVYYEAPFVLLTSSDIKSSGQLSLKTEDFSIKATVSSTNEYFILIKNFTQVYSVFSSGTGKGKVSSITPSTVTKKDTTLITGDYAIN